MASFLLLPTEIAALILDELSNEDLPPLRFVCKTTAAWTHDRFADAFFRTRRVMIEQRSLEGLDMISKHAILGPSVKNVEIFVCHLVPRDEVDSLHPPISEVDYPLSNKPKQPNCINESEYSKHFRSQERLVQNGSAVACLTQIMKRLSHCDRIHIRDVAACFPWGWNRLMQEIGVRPERTINYRSEMSVQFVRDALRAVFTAMAESGTQAETLQISIGDKFGLSTCVNPSMLVGPGMAPMTHVRHLMLSLLPGLTDDISPSDQGTWAAELNQFCQLLPGLSKLELESECCAEMDHNNWFSNVCYKVHIPNLESLRLEFLVCHSDEMAHFLLRHRKTLRYLDFNLLELSDGTPNISWCRLLKKIRAEMSPDTYTRISRCVGDTYYIDEGTGIPETMEARGTNELAKILSLLSTSGFWD